MALPTRCAINVFSTETSISFELMANKNIRLFTNYKLNFIKMNDKKYCCHSTSQADFIFIEI
ncbi:hypothetical protein ALC62_01314 [Cyphomyrmex costatus]|uniref:Uncharacterized protein n=1 Tax=Cyphomyrmex costatus TaxID=456900 RepID=A0A195D4J0_9HYME|nr:hypothetical protein ALC62_01314 [Cyphomyrmex costatus]